MKPLLDNLQLLIKVVVVTMMTQVARNDLTVGEVIGSECSDNFKAIIVQTKKCRDLLKGIFQKEYHRQKKGEANREVCSVLQKQQKEGECEAALCVEESFKAFHTKLQF